MNIWWSLGLVILSFSGGFLVEHWHDSGKIVSQADQIKVCGDKLTQSNAATIQAQKDGLDRVNKGMADLEAVDKANKPLQNERKALQTAPKVNSATLTCQDADSLIRKNLVVPKP